MVVIINPKKSTKERIVKIDRIKSIHGINAVYDSVEQPEISYEEALATLNNQKEWKKLNLGEKLNVARVYSYGIAGELDIKPPDIHLVCYNLNDLYKKFFANGHAVSIKHGIFLNISRMKIATNVAITVAHEMKHIHHLYALCNGYKPKTLPSEEEIENWKSAAIVIDGMMHYSDSGLYDYIVNNKVEDDARKFAWKHTKKTFGEEKTNIRDTLYLKIVGATVDRSISKKVQKENDKTVKSIENYIKESNKSSKNK